MCMGIHPYSSITLPSCTVPGYHLAVPAAQVLDWQRHKRCQCDFEDGDCEHMRWNLRKWVSMVHNRLKQAYTCDVIRFQENVHWL